ncbi:MAG: hypothetical protein ACREFQ_03700 [Stellaceae bacterium]
MGKYHFNLIGDDGLVVRERDTARGDDFQPEAMVRILLLSRGTRAVEAWREGALLYRSERRDRD